MTAKHVEDTMLPLSRTLGVCGLILLLAAGLCPAAEAVDKHDKPETTPEKPALAPTTGETAVEADGTVETTIEAGQGTRFRIRVHTSAGGAQGRIFGPLSADQIEDILGFTGEHLPELREHLLRLQAKDEQEFRVTMRRLRFDIRQLRRLKDRDEKAFRKALQGKQLRWRSQTLADRFHRATDADKRRELRKELREVQAQLFDAQLVAQKAHLERLQERIKQFRERLEKQRQQRDEIIEERLRRIINNVADSEAAESKSESTATTAPDAE